VARAEAYLHAKFHIDPSNRLAIVHERYRQSDRQRTDSIGLIVLQAVDQKLDETKKCLKLLKSHPAFTPQPQSIIALWPVLISHPAKGWRLSWPRYGLVK